MLTDEMLEKAAKIAYETYHGPMCPWGKASPGGATGFREAVKAAFESVAPERLTTEPATELPQDLVEKMLLAYWGEYYAAINNQPRLRMAAALRVALEAPRFGIKDKGANDCWEVRLDGDLLHAFGSKKDAERYRRGLVAELTESEAAK